MRFTVLLALAFLLAPKTWGASVSDAVQFSAAANWKKSPDDRSPFPTDKYVPEDGRNAALMITLIPIEVARITDEASLKALYLRIWTSTVSASAGAPDLKTLNVVTGSGLYATNEDPTLVGNPPKRDDFKFATPMLLWLRPDILVQATLLTDTADGSDFTEGMQIVQSARVVGHLSPISSETKAALEQKPILIRGPDAVLLIPMSTFKPTGAADEARHYFAFINNRGINLSGWMDEASRYSGFSSFWAKEKAKLEQQTGFKIGNEQTKLIGAWTTVLYTVDVGGRVQRNLRACRTTGKTWADLHLSVMANAGTDADLEAVVKTLVLKRD
jgi:hypothetical protein